MTLDDILKVKGTTVYTIGPDSLLEEEIGRAHV